MVRAFVVPLNKDACSWGWYRILLVALLFALVRLGDLGQGRLGDHCSWHGLCRSLRCYEGSCKSRQE